MLEEPVDGSGRGLRVGLNLLHALPEIGGGWNYIGRFLGALAETDHETEYVAFNTEVSRRLLPPNNNWQIVSCPVDARSRARRIWYESTVLQEKARELRLDCMHWFANTQGIVNVVPAVVTVHDLQAFRQGSEYSTVKRLYLRTLIRRTVRQAGMLLPVSAATAAELVSVLEADESRMAVVPVVLNQEFRPAPEQAVEAFRRRRGLPGRFWIYVGHYYRHKNHLRLLDAYKRLVEKKLDAAWPLVLRGRGVGMDSEIAERVRHLDLERSVLLLPELEENELPLLFSAATAQIFPSLYEGMGIPVLEAMACGCPVVAGDLAPIRAVAGAAVLYCDVENVDSIAVAMCQVQDGTVDLEAMRESGLKAARCFRQELIVPVAVGAYRRASGCARERAGQMTRTAKAG